MAQHQRFQTAGAVRVVLGLLLLVLGAVARADANVSYMVVQGKAVSDTRATDVTLLMEQPSGRTWVLTQRGNGSPVWEPVPYGEGQGLTTMTLPPPSPDTGMK